MPCVGTIAHVKPPHKGDSFSGIKASHAKGYTSQDVNVHVTKDGHVVAIHWLTVGQNRYHDPMGKIARTRSINTLTLAECQRLRPDDGGPQRIDAVINFMPWCAENGFALCLEAKPDKLARLRSTWEPVAAAAEATGAVVIVMTIQRYASRRGLNRVARLERWEADAKVRMRAAMEAGLPTMLLYRSRVSSDWWRLLSAVKGGPKPPEGVGHLGTGLSRIKKLGGNVTPRGVRAGNRRVVALGGTLPRRIAKPPMTPPTKPPAIPPAPVVPDMPPKERPPVAKPPVVTPPTKKPSATDVVVWGLTTNKRVARMGRRTAAHLDFTIARLAVEHPGAVLHVIQSAYNVGVSASAGTHDKDGVLDVYIEGMSWWDMQRFLRECGWAAWYRFPPAFGRHIHMISIGCPGPVGIFVPGQLDDYRRRAFGLKGQHDSGSDHSWFPEEQFIFDYEKWENDMTKDEIASAPIAMLSGPDNVERTVTLQNVLRDLEGTQDLHGKSLREMNAKLNQIIKLLGERA